MKFLGGLFLLLVLSAGTFAVVNPGQDSPVAPEADVTAKCGLCGIVINELEGFLSENLTESEIIKKINSNLCNLLASDVKAECIQITSQIPEILEQFNEGNSPGVICVEMGFCQKPFNSFPDPTEVPTYVIDLDLPPEERFKEVCSNPKFQQAIQGLIKGIMAVMPKAEADLEALGKALNLIYFPSEYAREIRGCSEYVGIGYGWLTLFNLGYEVSDFCTSIIAQTTDGTIYHVRNMDFWDGVWLTGHLKNMTYQADYHKNGQLLFHATTFAGYAGVLSGMKPNGFSISIDTRNYPKGGIAQTFNEILLAIRERNVSLVSFLSRKVLTTQTTFEGAVSNLCCDELLADVYYIVGGANPNEGAVITRNRNNASDIWRLNSPSRWYEVETNYDHWKQPPWYDDRVVPANNGMNAIGQKGLSIDQMFKVLSTKPVLNLQSTFTMLASAKTGFYKSYSRYCPYPCAE